jgi:ERO1-like protein alpha
LKNLYFVYLLELRALTKAAPYLEDNTFYTGDPGEDKDTLIAVKELFNLFRSFPDHFDETTMFNGGLQVLNLVYLIITSP